MDTRNLNLEIPVEKKSFFSLLLKTKPRKECWPHTGCVLQSCKMLSLESSTYVAGHCSKQITDSNLLNLCLLKKAYDLGSMTASDTNEETEVQIS